MQQYPDIPAIGETVKGYEFTAWIGAFAPAGTPKPIVDRLNAELKRVLAAPDVAKILGSQTLEPLHMTPEQFARSPARRLRQVREGDQALRRADRLSRAGRGRLPQDHYPD